MHSRIFVSCALLWCSGCSVFFPVDSFEGLATDSGASDAAILDAQPVDAGVRDLGDDAGVLDNGPQDVAPTDTGVSDVGDTGLLDDGVLDTGSPDIGAPDTGLDAGEVDRGIVDAGDMDAGDMDAGDVGMLDQGAPDLGPPDLGPPDLGPPDLGPPDLGPPDLGPPDLGTPDAGFCPVTATFCDDFDLSINVDDGWTGLGGTPGQVALTLDPNDSVSAPNSLQATAGASASLGHNVYQLLTGAASSRIYRFWMRVPSGIPASSDFVFASTTPSVEDGRFVSMSVSPTRILLINDLGANVVGPIALGSGWNEIELELGTTATGIRVNGSSVAQVASTLLTFPLAPVHFALGLPFVNGTSPAITANFDNVVILDTP